MFGEMFFRVAEVVAVNAMLVSSVRARSHWTVAILSTADSMDFIEYAATRAEFEA